jgi:hypothetical protein
MRNFLIFISFILPNFTYAADSFKIPAGTRTVALNEVSGEGGECEFFDYNIKVDLKTGEGFGKFLEGYGPMSPTGDCHHRSCNFKFTATNAEIKEISKAIGTVRYSKIVNDEETVDGGEHRAYFSKTPKVSDGIEINKYQITKDTRVWRYFTSGYDHFYDVLDKSLSPHVPSRCGEGYKMIFYFGED